MVMVNGVATAGATQQKLIANAAVIKLGTRITHPVVKSPGRTFVIF